MESFIESLIFGGGVFIGWMFGGYWMYRVASVRVSRIIYRTLVSYNVDPDIASRDATSKAKEIFDYTLMPKQSNSPR
jgi:hypothetical protein